MDLVPEYLYKILSKDNWEKSCDKKFIQLSADDNEFIHLATEEQLNSIIQKFWSNALEYFVLKLDRKQLKGRLVLEANPGGNNKYYHLYEGFIPMNAVVEQKIVKSKI